MKPANYPLRIARGLTFGPIEFHCKKNDGSPTNLSAYTVYAQAAVQRGMPHVLDLQPVISDAGNGVVTIPKLSDEQTLALARGNYQWDLVFEDAAGDRSGPYIAGPLTIDDIVTQP